MKIIISILLLVSVALADIPHSFPLTVQQDWMVGRTHGTSFSTARSQAFGTSGISSATRDTIAASAGYGFPTASQWTIERSMLLSAAINSQSVKDSLAVAEGNTPRIESIDLTVTARNAVYIGGCTGQSYCFVQDTCATTGNYTPDQAFSATSFYNDYLTPLTGYGQFVLCDSVPINLETFGTGLSAQITFSVTDRAILDEIYCLTQLPFAGSGFALTFALVTCFDYTDTDPGTTNPYAFHVAFHSLEHATVESRPSLTIQWTEVEPSNSLNWFQANPFSQYPFGQRPSSQ